MSKKWYPVIDYVECIECGSCVGKCKNGVYDLTKTPIPVVVNTLGCIDHCHGCGDICPVGAITYLGEDTPWVPPMKNKKESENTKEMVIDFLYLDLNTCERCMATDSTLDEAVEELSAVLKTLGYYVKVNKINITSEDMASKYEFLSSPTIRINGNDICLEVKENNCQSCGDICGSDVDCRVFVYEGEEYEQPPKAMIVDGILKAIYSKEVIAKKEEYTLPENLKNFFGKNQSSCCDSGCDCEGGCG